MKRSFFVFAMTFFGLFFYSFSLAATTDHVVISQIQIDSVAGTGGVEDDWIELYNPNSIAVDLTDWSIQKTSKTGGSLYRKKLTGTIPAFGYFLIVRNHTDTAQSLKDAADVLAAGTGFSLSDDNTVYLVNNNEDITDSTDSDIVDMVGMGDTESFEGTATSNPEDGGSIERKPGSGSGNGEDTDNNSSDFFAQSSPHPRNSTSTVEEPPAAPVPAEPPPESTGGSSGQSPPIFELEITEIFPNPEGADSGSEWVEIYNADNVSVDLSGWYLDDSGDEDLPGKSALVIAEGTVIEKATYLVVEIPKGKFALNNSDGDTVRIFDSNQKLRLEKEYPGPARSGYSFAVDTQNQWEWTETPTPGELNSFTTVAVFSSDLRISETLPNPQGSDLEGEFIELHNFSNDSVDLTDWVVADSRKRFVISEEDFFDVEVAEDGFFVLYREVTGISLNNTGVEEVTLFNPAGEVVSKMSFEANGKEGQSYSWGIIDKYQWTLAPTPGRENEIVLPEFNLPEKSPASRESDFGSDEEILDESRQPEEAGLRRSPLPEISLGDVRQVSPGSRIVTSGVVAVPPGVLEDQVLYLQGSGIRVFLASLPNFIFSVGDLVELSGEVSSFHNELQLKVDDVGTITVLDQGLEVMPKIIQTGELGEELEGNLVSLSGTLTNNQGQTIFVDDGSGEARILIRESTGIVKPKMRKGDEVTLTGVVSQFNDNYRVLPRFQEDVRVGGIKGVQTLPRTGSNFWLSLAVFEGFCLILLEIFALIKRKRLQNL